MATIVLTAVGGAIGGPIGGLIGAYVGSQIDAEIFKSPAREGPQIKELNVQTSSYGSSIPAVFGAMRVAGSVIWSTDLIENRNKKSGGKGKPATVDYTYSISMAVALSSRPIARIGRIWADGNLLRGAAGDFKVPTEFRVYTGHEDQSADALIASAEGMQNAPAFRGIAYAMFEGLQLGDFGNRIPSLTFEVFERDAPVPISDIASASSGGLIVSTSNETVQGYALEGGDGRAGLSALLSAIPLSLRSNNNHLELNDFWQLSDNAKHAETAAQLDNARYVPPEQYRLHKGKTPISLSVRHYDPAREYQIGVQRSSRADTGRQSGQIDLPATLNANAARRLADLQLLQIQRTQRGWRGHAIIGDNAFKAGDWITAGKSSEIWQITEIEHLGLVSRISAQQAIISNPGDFALAESGRSLSSDDIVIGATQMIVMDLPALSAADPQRSQIAVAAAGLNKAWRSAALFAGTEGSLTAIGITAPAAIIGTAENIVPVHSPWLPDNQNALVIKLLHDDMQLPAGSGSPFSIDAPYIWLAGEVIRYGLAEYLGAARYRISRLIRGCNGSEGKVDNHQIGDKFVLLEADTLRLLDDVSVAADSNLQVEAVGVGDDIPSLASVKVEGLAIKPLPPVHGRARITALNEIILNWVRRVRVDFGWQDGVEQPLIEDTELYSVEIWNGLQLLDTIIADRSELIIPASTIAAWGIASSNDLRFNIKQIGKFAQSNDLIILF